MVLGAPVTFEAVHAFGRFGTALIAGADASRRSGWRGWLCVALLVAAALRAADGAPRLLARVLLANLAFHLAFHLRHGDALVANSLHWAFALVAGPVLLAVGRGRAAAWVLAALAAAAAWLAVRNVATAPDLVDVHAAFRDHGWRLEAAVAGGDARSFAGSGRLALDAGSVRPFLLYPDAGAAVDERAPLDAFQLAPFHLPESRWRWLGDGSAGAGSFAVRGRVPEDVPVPAWISLHVDGVWRGHRIAGFVFPQPWRR
jgi:hypothetical protein